MGTGKRWALAAVASLAAAALMLPAGSAGQGSPAARVSSNCHSHLSNGAGGHVSLEPSSPCIVGNVYVECSERAGRCEGACGDKLVSCNWLRYMDCRVSAELGKIVKVVENEKEGLEGTRIENPHKTVTCKGSATVLAAYVTNGKRASLGGYKTIKHGTHTVTVTLYLRKDSPGLDVMAQH